VRARPRIDWLRLGHIDNEWGGERFLLVDTGKEGGGDSHRLLGQEGPFRGIPPALIRCHAVPTLVHTNVGSSLAITRIRLSDTESHSCQSGSRYGS
jgi:hypothetical protein